MIDERFLPLIGCALLLAMLISFGAVVWTSVKEFVRKWGKNPE